MLNREIFKKKVSVTQGRQAPYRPEATGTLSPIQLATGPKYIKKIQLGPST